MMKKIVMYALIALVLVPASVLAAGFWGQGSGAQGQAQGSCLHDGQACTNQTGLQGSCTQARYRLGTQGSGTIGEKELSCNGDGQCTGDQKQTLAMHRLRDGSGCAGRNTP